jgi:hypothetical protein
VRRSAWGRHISILASCETLRDVKLAWRRNYAAAVVVAKFESERAYMREGVKLIPCPAQTREGKVQCITCKLCLRDGFLKRVKAAIAFVPHGSGARKVRERLVQIGLD